MNVFPKSSAGRNTCLLQSCKEKTRALKCRTLGAILLVSLHSLLASFTSLFVYSLSQYLCNTRIRFVAWLYIHTFSLSGTTALHCGHTLLGGMIKSTKNHKLQTSSHKKWQIIPKVPKVIICTTRRVLAI